MARLQFEQRQVTVTAEPGAQHVTGSFAFENVGEQAVTITRVSTSCGCTAGAADKLRYEPGERGTLQATLEVGQRQGSHTSRLVVHTDAAGGGVTSLTLEATLPRVLSVEPRLMFWRAQDPRDARTLSVTLGEAEGLQLLAVRVGVAREAVHGAGATDEAVLPQAGESVAVDEPQGEGVVGAGAKPTEQVRVRTEEGKGSHEPAKGAGGGEAMLIAAGNTGAVEAAVDCSGLLPSVHVAEGAGIAVELRPVVKDAAAQEPSTGEPQESGQGVSEVAAGVAIAPSRRFELLITPRAEATHERIELDVLLPGGGIHTTSVQARVLPQVRAPVEP